MNSENNPLLQPPPSTPAPGRLVVNGEVETTHWQCLLGSHDHEPYLGVGRLAGNSYSWAGRLASVERPIQSFMHQPTDTSMSWTETLNTCLKERKACQSIAMILHA